MRAETGAGPGFTDLEDQNHDGGRSVNRYGRTSDLKFFPAVSKMLAFFTMTLGGTIFLHQGQEIGTRNLTEDVALSDYMDMATHSEWDSVKFSRMEEQRKTQEDVDMSNVMREVLLKARDHGRIPIAWDDSKGAGFTTGKPWMTLGTTYKEVNVKEQEDEKDSVLSTWRDMIAFRKAHPEELVYGKFELVDAEHEQVFAYWRTATDGERMLIALNWSPEKVEWKIPAGLDHSTMKSIGILREQKDEVSMGPYACIAWLVQ